MSFLTFDPQIRQNGDFYKFVIKNWRTNYERLFWTRRAKKTVVKRKDYFVKSCQKCQIVTCQAKKSPIISLISVLTRFLLYIYWAYEKTFQVLLDLNQKGHKLNKISEKSESPGINPDFKDFFYLSQSSRIGIWDSRFRKNFIPV